MVNRRTRTMTSYDHSFAYGRLSRRKAPRQPHLLTVVLAFVSWIPYCSSQTYTAADIQTINQACAICDGEVLPMITNYQNNFRGILENNSTLMNLTALEIGNLHCRRFSQIAACYTNCTAGFPVTYSSSLKGTFQSFYTQFCNEDCRLSFLPACYINAGVPYGLYRTGCDEDQNMVLSGISACINFWMDQQNCRGVCSKGQRAAAGLNLTLEGICRIPNWDYNCQVVITACTEQSYGPYGSTFIAGGPVLDGLGQGSCWSFGGTFAKCMMNSLTGDTVFGTPPYTISYSMPCASYINTVKYLIQISNISVSPLCSNPNLNLTGICPPPFATSSAAATTTSTTSLATSTAAPAVAASSPSSTSSSMSTAAPTTFATSSPSALGASTMASPTAATSTAAPATFGNSSSGTPIAMSLATSIAAPTTSASNSSGASSETLMRTSTAASSTAALTVFTSSLASTKAIATSTAAPATFGYSSSGAPSTMPLAISSAALTTSASSSTGASSTILIATSTAASSTAALTMFANRTVSTTSTTASTAAPTTSASSSLPLAASIAAPTTTSSSSPSAPGGISSTNSTATTSNAVPTTLSSISSNAPSTTSKAAASAATPTTITSSWPRTPDKTSTAVPTTSASTSTSARSSSQARAATTSNGLFSIFTQGGKSQQSTSSAALTSPCTYVFSYLALICSSLLLW